MASNSFEIQQSEETFTKERFVNIVNIPELPEGKDKYFFVSHSSEERDIVFSYVEELERRFNLSCVFADRDFQPGKDITENVKEGMARSLKVLLFLSQKFHESPWCKFEREFAFITSIENGTSCVIPVLLEKCEIPTTLVSLTYVDATHPYIDVPERIASALVQTFTTDGFLPQNLTSALSNYENGYSFRMSAQRHLEISSCRPSKYQFETSADLFKKLKRCKVEVMLYAAVLKTCLINLNLRNIRLEYTTNEEISQSLLEKTIKVVNKSSVMWSYDFLRRCNLLLWSIMGLPLLLFLCGFSVDLSRVTLATQHRYTNEDIKYMDQVATISGLVLIISAILIPVVILCVPLCCHHKQRDIAVQRRVWKLYADEFINSNVLVIFSGRKNKKPVLHIMRYNVSRCKDYLTRVITDSYSDTNTRSAEIRATSMIKSYVCDIMPTLADDFESLPEAPYNRHNVKKGKMCFCQILEHRV